MNSVPTNIRYINAEWRDSEAPPSIGDRQSRRNNTAYQAVEVTDARTVEDNFGLETAGFELTHMAEFAGDRGKEAIEKSYYPQVAELIRKVTGADATFVLSYQLRTEDQSDFNNAYARFVHCDYHLENLHKMSLKTLDVHNVEPHEGDTYVWYNTWQPVDNTVCNNALAVCDWRYLPTEDVIGYNYTGYVGKSDDGSGGSNSVGNLVSAPVYNPRHRWYYYREMKQNEVLLMKQLDGRTGRAQLCPHTSFIDASISDTAPPRRSIEVRILGLFRANA
jgi:hypothetical protein